MDEQQLNLICKGNFCLGIISQDIIELQFQRSPMNKEEVFILQNISTLQDRQDIILPKANTPQQQFLALYLTSYLLRAKYLPKNVKQVLPLQNGTFGHFSLKMKYISACMEKKIDLPADEYKILNMLTEWIDFNETLKISKQVRLLNALFQGETFDSSYFSKQEELIVYINYIGADLLKLVRRRKYQEALDTSMSLNSSRASVEDYSNSYTFDHLQAEDLLQFLEISIPKILFNIILPNDVLPPEMRKKVENFECLFRNQNLQYFSKTRVHYQVLLKTILKSLLCLDLKPPQMKYLMELTFRYFYIFHHDKKHGAIELFIQAYNKLTDPVRHAMSDEFILFFKVVRKLGKQEFIEFLSERSEWIKETLAKFNIKSLIGYPKDNLNPFNPLGITDKFTVERGKVETRTFQILHDYSLFYFRILVESLDINIRLYYLGDFESSKPGKTLLLEQEKKQNQFKTSIMAAKRGLYMFQFDNTYSWIKNKTILYQNVILSPMEIKATDQPKWIPQYYENVEMNKIYNSDAIVLIEPKKEKKTESKEKQAAFTGEGEITKENGFFILKITKKGFLYVFETDNEERFIEKFNNISEDEETLKWTINGEPLYDKDLDKVTTKKKKSERIEFDPEKDIDRIEKNRVTAEKSESQATNSSKIQKVGKKKKSSEVEQMEYEAAQVKPPAKKKMIVVREEEEKPMIKIISESEQQMKESKKKGKIEESARKQKEVEQEGFEDLGESDEDEDVAQEIQELKK